MKNHHHLLLSTTALISLQFSSISHAALATEYWQYMSHAEILKQVDEAMTQSGFLKDSELHLENNLRLLEKNTTMLEQHEWGNTIEDLNELSEIVQENEALAYSLTDIDLAFEERFKPYDAWAKDEEELDYHAQVREWDAENTHNTKAVLKAAKHHGEQFSAEDETLKKLEQMSEEADGQLKAIQVNNQITAQQVRQAQLARQLELAKIQLEIATIKVKAEKEAAGKAQAEKFYASESETISTDGARY